MRLEFQFKQYLGTVWWKLFQCSHEVSVFQASKKYVSKELAKEIRVKAEPFIKWLKEAEEESSGNEEEDEDENIEVGKAHLLSAAPRLHCSCMLKSCNFVLVHSEIDYLGYYCACWEQEEHSIYNALSVLLLTVVSCLPDITVITASAPG